MDWETVENLVPPYGVPVLACAPTTVNGTPYKKVFFAFYEDGAWLHADMFFGGIILDYTEPLEDEEEIKGVTHWAHFEAP